MMMKGGSQMIRKILVATSLVVLAVGIANAEPQMDAQLSKAQVKAMIRGANTPQKYEALANYFRSRQQVLEQKARAERHEWALLVQSTAPIAHKYPLPVDSYRIRYEYSVDEAERMAQQADHYESLSASAAPSAVQ
jgi:hypothetical protein